MGYAKLCVKGASSSVKISDIFLEKIGRVWRTIRTIPHSRPLPNRTSRRSVPSFSASAEPIAHNGLRHARRKALCHVKKLEPVCGTGKARHPIAHPKRNDAMGQGRAAQIGARLKPPDQRLRPFYSSAVLSYTTYAVGFGETKHPQNLCFSARCGGKAATTSGKERNLEGRRPSKPPAAQATA